MTHNISRGILSGLSDKARVAIARDRIQTMLKQKTQIEPGTDAVDWIQSNFFIPELRGPMKLYPYQQIALREATRRGDDGHFVYSTVVWSDIKKSIKSCVAAGVALWRAYSLEWGSIIIIANDLKQADSRVGFYMRRAIELNPLMAATCQIRTKNYEIKLPNRTRIESVPIDPTGEAGSNADLVVFSELWGAHEEPQKRMWCLDDQTEALTRDGWKLGVDLTPEDWIAVYHEGNRVVTWEQPRDILCERFVGRLHTYDHRRFSFH